MDEKYDVVVLGTGLTECILAGLLSVDQKRVLHIDRNDYYGGESASLNLEQLWQRFEKDSKPPENLGKSRDYNVDLIPKFLMSQGKMVKMLLYANVTHNLEFKSVEGSYVLKEKKIHKVPATESEALGSKLMGMFEKRRFANFLEFIYNYDENDPKTTKKLDLRNMTTEELLKPYKFSASTIDFIGHALALCRDDSFLQSNAYEFAQRCVLYFESLNMSVHNYKGKSPYLYPLYGLGDLAQAFARLSAIYGGTYMLNQPFDEVLYDENGKVKGIRHKDQVATCDLIIADPSYFPEKVKKVSQVVRCICLMDHPIPNTNNAESCQIILPQNQVGRKSDIYISMVSHSHFVVPENMYLALVSTSVETDDPYKELEPGLSLLGPIIKKFYSVSDVYEPINDFKTDGIHISKSYDATTHFETVVDDVLRIYENITGKKLDLSKRKEVPQE